MIAGGQWKDDRDSKMYRSRVLLSLKDRGVEIYSVGVGQDASFTQMRDISSGGRYLFLVDSYDQLGSVRSRLLSSIDGSKWK